MTKFPPDILLDPSINKSFYDIINRFKPNKLLGFLDAEHTADFIHFTALTQTPTNHYRIYKCSSRANITYNRSSHSISNIYLEKICCKEGKDFNMIP